MLAPLSETERRRLFDLVGSLLARHAKPGPQEYRECRRLIEKLGTLDHAKATALEARVLGPLVEFDQLFWEDAVEARAYGKPVMNSRRRALEKAMLDYNLLSKSRLAQRQDWMQRIAARKVIKLSGISLVVDETVISDQLRQLDEDRSIVRGLFLPGS